MAFDDVRDLARRIHVAYGEADKLTLIVLLNGMIGEPGRRCVICQRVFFPSRCDARTCSGRCRTRLWLDRKGVKRVNRPRSPGIARAPVRRADKAVSAHPGYFPSQFR